MKRLALRRLLPAVALVAAVGLASGCDNAPPDHKDPRLGRVTISYSNCAVGSCVYDWKICVGRDLQIHTDAQRGKDGERVSTISNSKECEPLR